MRVLIATVTAGAGHLQAATALEEACRLQAEDVDVLGENVARLLGPVITSLQALGPRNVS